MPEHTWWPPQLCCYCWFMACLSLSICKGLQQWYHTWIVSKCNSCEGDTRCCYHWLASPSRHDQAFKFLFTSPTSSQDICTENDVESPPAQPTKCPRGQKAPTCGNVANLLGMRSVTPQAIVYVAVQVGSNVYWTSTYCIQLMKNIQLRFALSSTPAWNENDGCFSYPTFYNNIVDFFEEALGPASRAHAQSLLSWWTK